MSHHHAGVLPRGTLALSIGMVAVALVATAGARIAGLAPAASPVALREAEHVRPLQSRDLRFSDRADGAVVITDLSGDQVGMVPAGAETGFIRGVMRGLARDRRIRGLGPEKPFRLTAWADGELSLTDLATGRVLELSGFGTTNRAQFAALLAGAPR